MASWWEKTTRKVKKAVSDPGAIAATAIGAATGGWALPALYGGVKALTGNADDKAKKEYGTYRQEQAEREGQRQELIGERNAINTQFQLGTEVGLKEVRDMRGDEMGRLATEQAYWDKYRQMPSKSIAEMLLQKQGALNARGMLGAAAAAGGRGANQMRAMREARMGGEQTMSDSYMAQGVARVEEENKRAALAAQAMAQLAAARGSNNQMMAGARNNAIGARAGFAGSQLGSATAQFTGAMSADNQAKALQEQIRQARISGDWALFDRATNALSKLAGGGATGMTG